MNTHGNGAWVQNPMAPTQHHIPTVPNPVMGMQQQPGDEAPKRRWPKRVLVGVGLVGVLLLGACMGGAGQVSSNVSLREDLQVVTGQLDAASAENDEMTTLLSQQTQEFEGLEEEVVTLEGEAVALAGDVTTLETSVTDLEAQLASVQAELAAAQATVAERDTSIVTLQADLASAQAASAPVAAPLYSPPAASTPAPVAAPASAYYANCDAVRAAGAAPISVGQAGYGRHLDRDGDGVGCES